MTSWLLLSAAALALAPADVGPGRTGRTTVAKIAQARPLAAVRRANRSALREPGAAAVNATQVHGWREGTVYQLYAAPEHVSDIALQAGEALVSVAAGDTVRWIIGDTSSGSGAGRRTHVLVKPSAVGLRTNLVIATDRRVYHLDLRSTATTATTGMSWTYPEDGLVLLRREPDSAPTAAVPAIEALDFNYRISGARAAWRPVRAFNDGRQVYIEFSPALAHGEAPPLFVVGASGQPELVNFRLRGRYYVVDRLFDRAELRLGGRRQQIVRIERTAPSAGRR